LQDITFPPYFQQEMFSHCPRQNNDITRQKEEWILLPTNSNGYFKNRLDKHWANYAFLYDYLVNYNGTGSLFVVSKNCENLDVDLEATACVHSLQYSTVLTRRQLQLPLRRLRYYRPTMDLQYV